MEKKENNIKLFNLFKWTIGSIFLLYYRPKLVNKNNIPADGAIIVCGNHIHLCDQCLPILSTKRMLHYMAKKEYFDSKFAWFFKLSGCISVNRAIHDDDAKQKAISVLNDGFGLGIYPEGTRNQIVCKKEILDELYKLYKDEMSYKKFEKIIKNNQVRVSQIDLLNNLKNNKKITDAEYKKYILDSNNYLKELIKKEIITYDEWKESLLLPIKFGTVSMAQKTGAVICPYTITGKYKLINNKLRCTFLEPITVSKDDNLEEANKKLRDELLDSLAEFN